MCAPRHSQGLFVFLLNTTTLTDPHYNDQHRRQFKEWRRTDAHSVDTYDVLSDRTLARRVCENAVTSESASIAAAHKEINEYLGQGGATGTLMASLALVTWYCTLSKEVNSTIDSYHITRSIPVGPKTVIVRDADGIHTVNTLNHGRVLARIGVGVVRLVLAGFMTYAGSEPRGQTRTRAPHWPSRPPHAPSAPRVASTVDLR